MKKETKDQIIKTITELTILFEVEDESLTRKQRRIILAAIEDLRVMGD